MIEVRDQVLSGDQLIDGHTYINCVFRNARLIHEGGQPPGFDGCAFERSNFVFQGPAGHTLNLLRSMAPRATNMREVVMGLIPELKD